MNEIWFCNLCLSQPLEVYPIVDDLDLAGWQLSKAKSRSITIGNDGVAQSANDGIKITVLSSHPAVPDDRALGYAARQAAVKSCPRPIGVHKPGVDFLTKMGKRAEALDDAKCVPWPDGRERDDLDGNLFFLDSGCHLTSIRNHGYYLPGREEMREKVDE